MIPNLDTFEWEASKPIIDILRPKTYKDIVYLQELTGINYAAQLHYGYTYKFQFQSTPGALANPLKLIPAPASDYIAVYKIKSTPIYYSHKCLVGVVTNRNQKVAIMHRARYSKEHLSVPFILLNKADVVRLNLLYDGLNWLGPDAPSRS